MWFNRDVTCSSTFTWFVLKPHYIGRKVCFDTLCNTPRLLDDSYTTTLHAVTFHSTSCWPEPFIGNPFWDLDNLLRLFSKSMRFFSVFYPHSHAFWKTFQKVIHPITTTSQTCLTMEFLSDALSKSRCILLVYVILIKSFKSSLVIHSHTYTAFRSLSFSCDSIGLLQTTNSRTKLRQMRICLNTLYMLDIWLG